MMELFRKFTVKERCYIGISLIFIFLQVWLDLKLPDHMSEITTLVETEGSDMADILTQGFFMLLCALGSMAASIAVAYLAAKVAAGLAFSLRGLVYNKVLDLSTEDVSRFSTASLTNRTTNDITQIQSLVAMGLQAIVKAPILAAWAIVKISGKSWQWTTATAVAIFILIVMLGATLVFAVPRFKKIQTLTDNLNRITREQLTGIRVVRAYNAEQYQEKKFSAANDELVRNNLTANRCMALMSPGMTLINSGLTLAVYWLGAYLINAAGLAQKLGVFSDMVVFSNYAMQVIMAFMMLNMIFVLLPRAQVSAKRICEVIRTEIKITDGTMEKGRDDQKGIVEFRHVSFRYPGAGGDTLTDISFTAGKGETTAFIGATGSGKSTLVNLIPRLYDATDGQILVDGVDVKKYIQKELRNRIGYVPQKTTLFSGTVSSNVAYGENGQTEITEDSICQAVMISQAQEFVEQMEGTYDAPISQGGTNVSGGQRQRLAIARAVAREPEILIFDDSFSALDYRTDCRLREELNRKTVNVTKLIVAQRIGTIRHADQIIVLDHGKIVGKGTHRELMQGCPVYQEIAGSQLSKEELENG